MEPETQPKFDSSELLIIMLENPWHYERRKSRFSLDKKNSETIRIRYGLLNGRAKCHVQTKNSDAMVIPTFIVERKLNF